MKTFKEKTELAISGLMVLKVHDSKTGKLKREYHQKNKVMSNDGNGVNLIMRLFGGDEALSINLNRCKIGTGTTAPAIADTDLETPVTFNVSGDTVIKANSVTNVNSVELDFFLSDADLPNGTYKEFGIFTDDENIFTRVLINAPDGYSKADGEDATIKYTITITPQ